MQDYQSFGVNAAMGLCVAGFLLVIAFGIWRKLRPSTARAMQAQSLGFVMLGIGVVCFASTNLYAIHTSSKVIVQGSLYALRQVHGKGHTSFFYIQNVQSPPQLSTDYDGPALENDEYVRVTYLSNTTDVTDLQVIDGPNAGWTLHEGNGTGSDIGLLCLSGVFFFLGYLSHHRPSRSDEPADANRLSTSAGIEDPSLLHLDSSE